eukprot:Gb_03184 [translate_table: standard]
MMKFLEILLVVFFFFCFVTAAVAADHKCQYPQKCGYLTINYPFGIAGTNCLNTEGSYNCFCAEGKGDGRMCIKEPNKVVPALIGIADFQGLFVYFHYMLLNLEPFCRFWLSYFLLNTCFGKSFAGIKYSLVYDATVYLYARHA